MVNDKMMHSISNDKNIYVKNMGKVTVVSLSIRVKKTFVRALTSSLFSFLE